MLLAVIILNTLSYFPLILACLYLYLFHIPLIYHSLYLAVLLSFISTVIPAPLNQNSAVKYIFFSTFNFLGVEANKHIDTDFCKYILHVQCFVKLFVWKVSSI